MKIVRMFVVLAMCSLNFDYGQSFDISSLQLVSLAMHGFGLVKDGLKELYHHYDPFTRRCQNEYTQHQFGRLDSRLRNELYGQHIAHQVVISAVKSHGSDERPIKALTMTFHGLPGTGKNYVSNIITGTLYGYPAKSRYVHTYNGRHLFRSDGLITQYQIEIQRNLTSQLKACPRSIFIFDEIEKIPADTLDVLIPFLGYNPNIKDDRGVYVDATRAIFILLTNVGGTLIEKTMIERFELELPRQGAQLQDFERKLELALFNEMSVFYKSSTIESSLIDHYVPFLPLEVEHVIKCVIDSFGKRGVRPNHDQIEKAMQHLTFGPEPYNIYSKSGCKRLDQKVGSIIQSASFRDL